MPRIDIAQLRKSLGISQSELAQKLQINQSFLSAIENGRSPLPQEKENRLAEIFPDVDFSEFMMEPERDSAKSIDDLSETEMINLFLQRFHSQAHRHDDSQHHQQHHQRIELLEAQNAELIRQNGKLLDRLDDLMTRLLDLQSRLNGG
ncbi:MAG: helix-turn-helix domain-containing protein [Muribaculaceae bacterium]|nr:helix-turn-helix domain-containing protein [Muribaculaceae bacterium]